MLAAAREAQEGREDYIWAVLTGDPGLDPAQRLRLLYPNLLHVETVCQEAEMKAEEEESLSPQLSEEELFDAFFRTVNGRSMSPSQDVYKRQQRNSVCIFPTILKSDFSSPFLLALYETTGPYFCMARLFHIAVHQPTYTSLPSR